jgi:hypothetical protein
MTPVKPQRVVVTRVTLLSVAATTKITNIL